MTTTQPPSREEFIAYWKDYGVFPWQELLWYVGYLGGLALYASVIRRVDPDGRFLFTSLFLAIVYVVLVPYLTIRRVHTRFARFICCPYCGDSFAQDVSGAYHGPNPKFRVIIETGRCTKCGAQILSDDRAFPGDD